MSFPQTTPLRPVPGAFLNTPAVAARFQNTNNDPTQRRLFQNPEVAHNGVAATSRPGNLPGQQLGTRPATTLTGGGQPKVENVPPVVKAAKAVNTFLKQDEGFPELDSYCRQGASSEYDIPATESAWAPFHKTQMYPIPNQVFEQYNGGHMQTLMGLFAEINHAWVVIDNSLFLWDYTQPEPELIGFEDQPYQINAVALVAPKPGIFVNTITHILAVGTVNDMVLLGVSATETPLGTKAVSLYQTKMSLPIRGIDVHVITGTSDGRIFFGGTGDVDLYEVYYQSEEKWFSNRCGKINHTNRAWSQVVSLQKPFWSQKDTERIRDIVVDDSRKLVYTLSTTSTIRTYFMDGPGHLNEVICKDKLHSLGDTTHIINKSSLLNERMEIVAINAISKQEALKVHLMALTNTGCRLFFSGTNASSYLDNIKTSLAPASLQVTFVKFPPPVEQSRLFAQEAAEAGIALESNVLMTSREGSRFSPGYFLDFVAKAGDPNVDKLFISAPEAARLKNTPPNAPLRYIESGSWINLDSRAEAVGIITPPFSAAAQPLGFGNELAVQFDNPPTEFAILTNSGVHIVRRRRFVDVFATAIRRTGGDEGYNTLCRRMVQSYGRVETVATALAVACGHGGDSKPGVARVIDQTTEDRARACFVDFGGNPTIVETDRMTLTTDSVKLSSRHDALALYLSRLVRKLWNTKIVTVGVSAVGGIDVKSTVPLAKVSQVQEHLERLRKFLDANKGLIQGLSGSADLDRVSTRQEEVALQAEHQALHALQKLMESISEGISFVLTLFDERVADIYTRLDDAAKQQLNELTYERLFSDEDGKDLAKVLVKAIVNRNIENGSNVETVADALRRRCGSFCSPDDVINFKAQEQLKRASEQALNTNQSRTILHESLRLFEKVAGSLTYANLESAITQYTQLRYYAGAIQLCLIVARHKDRGNAALSWINDGKPAGDPRDTSFYHRKRCYDMIHAVLTDLDKASSTEPELVDGKLTLMATKKMEAYDVVNNSDDEVFHIDLYEWYLEQGWTDRILATDSPHVIKFLDRLAESSAEHAELLCRFYTNRHQYYQAAQVQGKLAISNFALDIKARINLLSMAKANASVNTVGVSRSEQQVLSHEVGNLLDIANIQDDILGRLMQDERVDAERRADLHESLNREPLDLSLLFNQYADEAGYYDLCLKIYHLADYRSSTTIQKTWRSLIEQVHDEVVAEHESLRPGMPAPPMPYEALSNKIREIAHHTSLDSFIFPIDKLLPELCRYAVGYQQDLTIGADPCWPVQLFLALGVSYDMITRVLENVFDTQDYGFQGMVRNRIIELIAFVISEWVAEVRRRGGASGKAGSLSPYVGDLLERCEKAMPPAGSGRNDGGNELAEIRQLVRSLKREVGNLSERMPVGGSLRFV